MLENIIQQMNIININAPTTINVFSRNNVIGSIISFMGDLLPEGYLLCDGSAVSRITYNDLFNVIGTTYGSGDEETTFNLPDLINKFLEGGDGTDTGTVKSAGLPNVEGYVGLGRIGDNAAGSAGVLNTWCGPFWFNKYTGVSNQNIATATRSGGSWSNGMSFDLSKANSIYGNSDTVQPPSIICKFLICYG